MVCEHRVQRGPYRQLVDIVREFQQYRLVEPLRRVRHGLEEPPLDRSQRHRAGHRALIGHPGHVGDVRGERGDGLVREEVARHQAQSGAPGAGHHLDGED